ncbi:MAG: hypothetical protein ACK4TO_02995 [Candidatus Nitrosotenuis sp.]
MKEILNLTKSDNPASEFAQIQKLNQNEVKMETIGATFESQEEIRQLLEQRIAKAMIPVAQSLLADPALEQDSNQIKLILESVATRIPSVEVQQYFRAGKNYFTINHQMGYVGNIFFKTLFDMVLGKNQNKSYQLVQENRFSIICRF